MQSARLDIESRALGWYSRVPSKSNPSDAASRLEFKSYSDCKRVHPSYKALLPEGIWRGWSVLAWAIHLTVCATSVAAHSHAHCKGNAADPRTPGLSYEKEGVRKCLQSACVCTESRKFLLQALRKYSPFSHLCDKLLFPCLKVLRVSRVKRVKIFANSFVFEHAECLNICA